MADEARPGKDKKMIPPEKFNANLMEILGDQQSGSQVPQLEELMKEDKFYSKVRKYLEKASPIEKDELALNLAAYHSHHMDGYQRLIRIIGRISQLCQEAGLGDKVSAIILEEGLRE